MNKLVGGGGVGGGRKVGEMSLHSAIKSVNIVKR